MNSIALIIILFVGFLLGAFALLGYMLWRIMDNDNMDDSNITNAQRILSHVVLHPHDFTKLYYLSQDEVTRVEQELNLPLGGRRAFWYADKDEFSDVVKTRPPF